MRGKCLKFIPAENLCSPSCLASWVQHIPPSRGPSAVSEPTHQPPTSTASSASPAQASLPFRLRTHPPVSVRVSQVRVTEKPKYGQLRQDSSLFLSLSPERSWGPERREVAQGSLDRAALKSSGFHVPSFLCHGSSRVFL